MAFVATPSGGKLYVATDKGKGTGPNNFPQRTVASQPIVRRRSSTYIGTLLYGSLATIDESEIDGNLADWTSIALASNRMKAAQEQIAFAGGAEHRITTSSTSSRRTAPTIRSSATFRRTASRLETATRALRCTAQAVTPNEHKLALQFGVLDNFFDSGRSLRRRPRMVHRGHRLGLSGEILAAELPWRTERRMTTRA